MERVVSSEMLYKGKLLNLRLDEALLSSGKKIRRELIAHLGASVNLLLIELRRFYGETST